MYSRLRANALMDTGCVPRKFVDDPKVATLVENSRGNISNGCLQGEVFANGPGLLELVRLNTGLRAVAKCALGRISGKGLEAEWVGLLSNQNFPRVC